MENTDLKFFKIQVMNKKVLIEKRKTGDELNRTIWAETFLEGKVNGNQKMKKLKMNLMENIIILRNFFKGRLVTKNILIETEKKKEVN